MQRLRAYLAETSATPRLVYVHCEGGIDRTGELIGAFELSGGASWASVVQRALAVAVDRDLARKNFNALHWFCFHWRETHNAALDCSQSQQAFLEQQQ